MVRGEQGYGPLATLTRLGYVLSGRVQVPSENIHSLNITIAHVLKTEVIAVRHDEMKSEIHKFWSNESFISEKIEFHIIIP